MRIRQAELEYALGREELQLLSLVEEIRALQSRLEKSTTPNGNSNPNTLFNVVSSGANLTLHAIQAIVGRFSIVARADAPGLYVEWTLDGEGLIKGDRILEANGKIIETSSKEEFSKGIGRNGTKCEFVVVRKRQMTLQQQQLIKSEEVNQRLQHRISYLEDQIEEMVESSKEKNGYRAVKEAPRSNGFAEKKTNGHITSINISNDRQDKPQIYQRGSFVTTIIDGSSATPPPSVVSPAKMLPKTPNKEPQPAHRPRIDVRMFATPKVSLQQSQSHHNIPSSNHHSAQKSANIENYLSARREQKRREYEVNSRQNVRFEERDRHSSHPNLLNDSSNCELSLYVNGFDLQK